MKKAVLPLIALPFLIVVVLLLTRMRWKFSKPPLRSSAQTETVASDATTTIIKPPGVEVPGRPKALLGETILRDYAKTNLPPENDLKLMSRLMENSLLLLKSAANRPLSANEDWADLLRGKNGAGERFLSDDHGALNEQHQLVDRWGSPLFFHAVGNSRYDLRSAGPDKTLWTEDDIHRNANGSFLHGRDLNSPSLLDAAPLPSAR